MLPILFIFCFLTLASCSALYSPIYDFEVVPPSGYSWDLYEAFFKLDNTDSEEINAGDYFEFTLKSVFLDACEEYDVEIFSEDDEKVGHLTSDKNWNFVFEYTDYIQRNPEAEIQFLVEFYLKPGTSGKITVTADDGMSEFVSPVLVKDRDENGLKVVRSDGDLTYSQIVNFWDSQQVFELIFRLSDAQRWLNNDFKKLYFVDSSGKEIPDTPVNFEPRISNSTIYVKALIPQDKDISGLYYELEAQIDREELIFQHCLTVRTQGDSNLVCQESGHTANGLPTAQGWVLSPALEKRDDYGGLNGQNNGQGNAPGGYNGHDNGLGNGHGNGNGNGNNNGWGNGNGNGKGWGDGTNNGNGNGNGNGWGNSGDRASWIPVGIPGVPWRSAPGVPNTDFSTEAPVDIPEASVGVVTTTHPVETKLTVSVEAPVETETPQIAPAPVVPPLVATYSFVPVPSPSLVMPSPSSASSVMPSSAPPATTAMQAPAPFGSTAQANSASGLKTSLLKTAILLGFVFLFI